MERTVYTLTNDNNREMQAELIEMDNGEKKLKVVMYFYPENDLTIDDICEKLGLRVSEEKNFKKPEVVTLDRKD